LFAWQIQKIPSPFRADIFVSVASVLSNSAFNRTNVLFVDSVYFSLFFFFSFSFFSFFLPTSAFLWSLSLSPLSPSCKNTGVMITFNVSSSLSWKERDMSLFYSHCLTYYHLFTFVFFVFFFFFFFFLNLHLYQVTSKIPDQLFFPSLPFPSSNQIWGA